MKEFRLLKADEIEVRISHTSHDLQSAMLLLYKDARCDMKILDETLGITGWQRTHEVINGQLFCNVSIYDDEKECWIVKQDVGTESFSEAEKGRASDSFKRACFNLGIGRELYTAPVIRVRSDTKINTKKDRNLKKYRVKSINYDDDRKIKYVEIEGYIKSKNKWEVVYPAYPNRNNYKKNTNNKKNIRPEIQHMQDIAKKVGISGQTITEKASRDFGKTKSSELTSEEINELIARMTQESFA